MKAYWMIIAGIGIWSALAGCQDAATDAELKKMCENLNKVRNGIKVVPEVTLTQEVNKDYLLKREKLVAWKAKDMKGWDDELAAKIVSLSKDNNLKTNNGKPATKESLTADYAKKKEIGAKQFDADFDALEVAKKKAIGNVAEQVKQKRAQLDAVVTQCVAQARNEKISKALAQCRLAASDKDTYWNKCK